MHRLGKCFFLVVLEAGSPRFKVPADPALGEDAVPDLQVAAFSLCPHMGERKWGCLLLFLQGHRPIEVGGLPS